MNVEKAIWSAYIDNPCRLYSIRELALHLKKSYPLIHQHTSRLIKEGYFNSRKLGKSILCYPNYSHSYSLLSLASADERRVSLVSKADVHLSLLYSFFSTKFFSSVLSVFTTEKEIVVILATNDKEEIESSLSQTALSKPIRYVVLADVTNNVDLLLKKSFVLFGFEQFHALIRSNYELYASKHNLVKLHE